MTDCQTEPGDEPPAGCDDCGEIFWSEDEQEAHDCPADDHPQKRLSRVRSDLIDQGIDVAEDIWSDGEGVLNVHDRDDDVVDAVKAACSDHGLRAVGRALKQPHNGDPFHQYVVVERTADGGGDA